MKPMPAKPSSIIAQVDASGTGETVPMSTVRLSACPSVPQVLVYVPGVRPRPASVALLNVSDPESNVPEEYPSGTTMPVPSIPKTLPVVDDATNRRPPPKDAGPETGPDRVALPVPTMTSPAAPSTSPDEVPNPA